MQIHAMQHVINQNTSHRYCSSNVCVCVRVCLIVTLCSCCLVDVVVVGVVVQRLFVVLRMFLSLQCCRFVVIVFLVLCCACVAFWIVVCSVVGFVCV